MKKLIVFLLFLLNLSIGYSQENKEIDSLKRLIAVEKNDSIITELYFKCYLQCKENELDKQKYFLDKIIQIVQKTKSKRNLGRYYLIYAFWKSDNAQYDSALIYHNKSLEIALSISDSTRIVYNYKWLSSINYFHGPNYAEVLKNAQNALNYSPSIADSIFCYRMMAAVFGDLKQYKRAFQYYDVALSIAMRNNHLKEIAATNIDIGDLYKNIGENLKALDYFLANKEIQEQIDWNLSLLYGNIGEAYLNIQKFDSAIQYFNKGLAMRNCYKKDSVAIITNIIKLKYQTKNYGQVIYFSSKYLPLIKKSNRNDYLSMIYKINSSVYEQLNDLRKSLDYYKLYKSISDTIFNEGFNKQIADMEGKYQLNIKEEQIKSQNIELQNQKLKAEQQRKQSWFMVVVTILSLLVVVFIAINLYNKRKANRLLTMQNHQITQQNEEITTQSEEIQKQHGIVTKQKKELTDSIHYAKRIQTAMLPSVNILNEVYPENFIFFKPRDIVSGDFFWMRKINHYFVIAAADCTGHGVPGAFMSMLGMSLLNEIVTRREITQANQILDALRSEIKVSLGQTGKATESKDGMDIALCVINTQTNELQFSGAYNPLLLVRNNEIIEYKANRMPIGVHLVEKPFENTLVQLQNNDCIYLFSDGYIDQFGGEKSDKFKRKRFDQYAPTRFRSTKGTSCPNPHQLDWHRKRATGRYVGYWGEGVVRYY